MNRKIWATVAFYGSGEIANNFIYGMGAMFLLNYYTDVAGIPAAAVGTLLLLIRVFDAGADIWAGRVVDRTSTRWGRFRPYLIWCAFPLAVANVLVFSVPQHWTDALKLTYAYVSYGLLGLLFSFVSIPYGSLSTAISQDSRVRAMLGVSREVVASLTAIFLAVVIAPQIHHHAAHGGESMHAIYTRYLIIFGLVGVVSYAVCFAGTKETIAYRKDTRTLASSLRTVFRNRALLFICLAQICIVAAYFSMNATIIYFARYVLKNTEVLVEIVVARKLLGMLVGVPLTAWLVKHFGRKSAFMVGLGAYITGFVLLYCFRTTDIALILAFFSVISVGQMLTASMAFALQSDTVEYGEYMTGERVEGMTYAFFSFARKCGQALGGAIPAFVLAASGYVPNLANQSADTVSGIYAALTLVPASLLGLTMLAFIFYPLTEGRYAEIVTGIQARRQLEVAELACDDARVPSTVP